MAPTGPRYTKEEFARRGQAMYETHVKPRLAADDHGKFVAVDIETGEYEIDAKELAACDRLHERIANAQVWLVRVGSPFTYRLACALTPFAEER